MVNLTIADFETLNSDVGRQLHVALAGSSEDIRQSIANICMTSNSFTITRENDRYCCRRDDYYDQVRHSLTMTWPLVAVRGNVEMQRMDEGDRVVDRCLINVIDAGVCDGVPGSNVDSLLMNIADGVIVMVDLDTGVNASVETIIRRMMEALIVPVLYIDIKTSLLLQLDREIIHQRMIQIIEVSTLLSMFIDICPDRRAATSFSGIGSTEHNSLLCLLGDTPIYLSLTPPAVSRYSVNISDLVYSVSSTNFNAISISSLVPPLTL